MGIEVRRVDEIAGLGRRRRRRGGTHLRAAERVTERTREKEEDECNPD